MINDLILRVTYNGVVTDLDVDGAVPLRLDISQVDNQEIGEVFGVSSQNFNLPGTSTNNKFFNHGYLESAVDVPGLYDTIECDVVRNGETLLQGNLQVNEVVTSDSGFITYDVTVSNKVVEFNEALKDKFFFEANFEDLNHELNYDNIVASWLPRSASSFLDGAIFYPLADYGLDDRLRFPDFSSRLSSDFNQNIEPLTGSSANPEYPLSLGQFLPAIGVREVFDKIFDQAGYAYTSSLIESTDFDNLFILFKNQDQLGVIASGVDEGNLFSGNVAPMFIVPAIPAGAYGASTTFLLNVSASVSDPGSNYSLVTGQYTAPKSGNYTFNASVNFTNGNNNAVANTGYFLDLYINDTFDTVIDEVRETSATNGDTFNLSGESTLLLNRNDKLSYKFVVSNQGNPDATDPIDIFTSTNIACTAAPLTFTDLPVSMSLQIDDEVKTIDLFKGLLTQFNLVAYSEQEQSKTIRLETFDEWMRTGGTKDWTEKYNSAKRISIKNPVSEEPRELRFSNVQDEDRISRIAKDQTPNFQYGTLRTLSNSNLTSGEKKVESSFSPTPLAPVVTSVTGSDGAVTLAFNQSVSRFIVPHLYKFKNNDQESFKFKPKIGYRTYYAEGDNQNSDLYASSVQYIESGAQETSGSFIDYSTLSNYEGYPVTTETKDLLFNSNYKKLSNNSSLYPSSGSSNFDNYWKNYIDSIYWQDGRKVTMDLFFNEYEYQDIKLNDQIIIGDNRYRINKIKGFNLTRRDIVTVELLKLFPVYTPVITPGEGTICPRVATFEAKNITSSSMTLSGSIISVGSGLKEKGFVVSTTDTTPTIEEGATKYVVAGTSAGEFNFNLTGLNANTTYYYQAYASSSFEVCGGAIYNNDATGSNTLTASLGCPAVTTASGSVQGPYKATLFASTTATGSGIVERGFVISATDSSPEIGEAGVKKKVNATGSAANPIESWSNIITGSIETWLSCSTTYNFRGYVSSSECLEYGSNLTLTTAACPTGSAVTSSCLPFSSSGVTNFGGACSETIDQQLYTNYSGSWPPTQGYLDAGGLMTVYLNSNCTTPSFNTYYAFDSSSRSGGSVNSFLRVSGNSSDDTLGDVIYIYNCEGP